MWVSYSPTALLGPYGNGFDAGEGPTRSERVALGLAGGGAGGPYDAG